MVLSAIVFDYLLATAFCFLSSLIVLSASAFKFLSAAVFYSLLVLTTLSAIVFIFFVSCSIQYLAFLFILDYFIKSISDSKDLLDYLVGSKLLKRFYLL